MTDSAKSQPIISLRRIIKDYTTGTQSYRALKGISFDIFPGEFVAIMGHSGSGKSTTMHIIGALDTPTAGEYFINGKNITTYNENQLADIRNREIGFVFQSFNLLPRTTVYKNVERPMLYGKIPTARRDQKVRDALRLVQLEDKAQNQSNHISGGQIQRVAIARALVMDPAIILADEPTGNLDSQTSREIMEILSQMNRRGRTIVLITHESDIAAYAQRIIMLRDGLVVNDGPSREILREKTKHELSRNN